MNLLITDGGRRLTVRPRNVSGVKEMEPHPELGPLCRVYIGERGGQHVVRGTFDEVTAKLKPADLEVRRAAWERVHAQLAKAVDLLQWCSGSADFGPGGAAREGWEKDVAPFLAEVAPQQPPTPSIPDHEIPR